jgi:DNA-binding response OmpR family regulator
MKVVLVDDEELVASALAFVVRDAGHEVLQCASPDETYAKLGDGPADVFVTDVRLSGADGVAFIRQVRASHPASGIVAISGGGPEGTTLENARLAGADMCLQKPFTGRVLLEALEKVAALRNG